MILQWLENTYVQGNANLLTSHTIN